MAGLVNPDDDSARVGFPPPLAYALALLAGLLADWALGLSLTVPIPWRLLAGMLVPLGGAVALSARMRFSRAGTDVRPWKPSRSIVTEGVYRLTRNPMYLGLTLAYLGLAGAFSSVAALAILPLLLAYIQIAVIAREERYLAAKFGDAYRDYTSRVRRWI